MYQKQLSAAGYPKITTEIVPAPEFYYAEDYHQQYLAKNPHGYCGLGGTGVTCPVGGGITTAERAASRRPIRPRDRRAPSTISRCRRVRAAGRGKDHPHS